MIASYQEIAALAVVAATVLYLVRRLWRAMRSGKVGGCGLGCPGAKAARGTRQNPVIVPFPKSRRDPPPK